MLLIIKKKLVTSKAIIVGLDPSAENPDDQGDYVIDFGIGRVEVD